MKISLLLFLILMVFSSSAALIPQVLSRIENCRRSIGLRFFSTRLLVVIYLITISSCSPVSDIIIEVLEPAEITLPAHIENVAFVKRNPYPVYDTGVAVLYDRTQEEIYIIDTICINKQFEGFFDALWESPLYSIDKTEIINLRRKDTMGINLPLTQAEVDQICEDYEAEALISLEDFRVRDALTIKYSNVYVDYTGTLSISNTVLWRIYDAVSDTLLDEYLVQDTTEWIAYAQLKNVLVDSLPKITNALREASYTSGYKYGLRIGPHWYDAKRYYYRAGDDRMRQAARLARENDWNGASQIWENIAYTGKKKIAARAAFNMALAYEMEDSIMQALDWAIKSDSLNTNEFTWLYIEILKQRKKNQKILQYQMPEF